MPTEMDSFINNSREINIALIKFSLLEEINREDIFELINRLDRFLLLFDTSLLDDHFDFLWKILKKQIKETLPTIEIAYTYHNKAKRLDPEMKRKFRKLLGIF